MVEINDDHLIMVVTFKKRHQSRKWKKKHGLLKKQDKMFFKRCSKLMDDVHKRICISAGITSEILDTSMEDLLIIGRKQRRLI